MIYLDYNATTPVAPEVAGPCSPSWGRSSAIRAATIPWG